MADTNHARVGKALHLLRDGLAPFLAREMQAQYGARWESGVQELRSGSPRGKDSLCDVSVQLSLVNQYWGKVFDRTLGRAGRGLVNELLEVRNRWAHQRGFSTDDVYRAVDSVARLLTSVSAEEAEAAVEMKRGLLRLMHEESVRGGLRSRALSLEGGLGLAPWRSVVVPHPDVSSGEYKQAEFAADLGQVHQGQGVSEYSDPGEFFRRTYLTGSLRRMLKGAALRLAGRGGDPVVQLQTNFGGGKTHSMLALYHFFSGVSWDELEGVRGVVGAMSKAAVRRAVLVGTKLRPGSPVTKPDGTVVHTLWGELAWQLGGAEGFARVAEDDAKATNPGDALREVLQAYAPCLVLIDEWVAYARQLHDRADLPAGSFETQFTFAQNLTESAKQVPGCLLVISLPASDSGSPADDTEVGGQRGREALDQLRNVVGRVEASWRPASAEESFEIVRRRLFEPIPEGDRDLFRQRDVTVRAFSELYRKQRAEFPSDCSGAAYEQSIRDAYPIHPEIFERLYGDWSTLPKFQRTRGVLRLMAAVIHCLWDQQEKSPLILPAHIAIEDQRVQGELMHYLPDNWAAILTKDVDGPSSLPLAIDRDVANFGKLSACRRVARTIFLGSAPMAEAAHRGLEDRRVKLGCVLPGESPSVFGDALRRLASKATYLYEDGTRYWYSTQPTVTKLAEDRAEQLKREPDKVAQALGRWLSADLVRKGAFARVHCRPQSEEEVPDVREASLAVLDPEQTHGKGQQDSPALQAARRLLKSRGTRPRHYQNALVFLAADTSRVQDLDAAVRTQLAWQSIVEERELLNLSAHQQKQAERQQQGASETVQEQLREVYRWLLVPGQDTPQDEIRWQELRLTERESPALRASRKLVAKDLLLTRMAPAALRMQLERTPLLWKDGHVALDELARHFASYLYLPRLENSRVLAETVERGLGLLTWEQDAFAFADDYDEQAGRYRGLCAGKSMSLGSSSAILPGLLVQAQSACRQMDAERGGRVGTGEQPGAGYAAVPEDTPGASPTHGPGAVPAADAEASPKRFYGTVPLDAARVGRDAAQVADEVIAHLVGLVGARVKVTLDIEAEVPEGVPEQVVRTVTENSRVLNFSARNFEKE